MTLPADILEISLNGMDIHHSTQANGSRVSVETFSWDSPASTIAVTQKPRGNGAWAGDAYLEPRDIVIGGKIKAPDRLRAAETFDAISSACALTEVPLVVNEGGLTRTCQVRRLGKVLHRYLVTYDGLTMMEWSASLIAADPRKVGAALVGSTGLPVVSGGFTFPLTFPLTISSTVVSGSVTLTNSGNAIGKVLYRIDGPGSGFQVVRVSGGEVITFASSLTLTAGQYLEVDNDAKTVLANGQSSRSGYVTRRGFSHFDPGVNLWAFSADSYEADALLTVTAYPSYL